MVVTASTSSSPTPVEACGMRASASCAGQSAAARGDGPQRGPPRRRGTPQRTAHAGARVRRPTPSPAACARHGVALPSRARQAAATAQVA
jgi:hypothetical protein